VNENAGLATWEVYQSLCSPAEYKTIHCKATQFSDFASLIKKSVELDSV
jgi:hypothetical protein